MNYWKFLRKNLLEVLFTAGFTIFLGWLVFIAVVSSRNPIFFDALSQIDVTSSYNSNLNIFRIIFEPLIGSFFLTGLEFEYWISIFAFFYIVLRSIILFLDKYRYNGRIKNNRISIIFRDSLKFTFTWGLVIFLIGIIIFGIGYLIIGVMFLSNNFRWILKVISWANLGLFLSKLIYNTISLLKTHTTGNLNYYKVRTKLVSKIQNTKLKKILGVTKSEITHLFATFWLILMLTQGLQYIRFPTQTIETNLGPNDILIDLHAHTTYSDGVLTPRQRVKWYMDQGIHAAAFSDHHRLKGAILAQEYVVRKNLDFTVIKAQEFTDDPEEIHLNIYGETDTVIIPDNYWGGENTSETLSCREAIQWAKTQGLYVTVNHYEENATAPFSFEELRDWGVDGFEIVNGASEQAADIRQFCLDNGLICMGGTDVHMNEDLNTFVKLTLSDPTNRSVDAIFEALKNNTHEVIAIKYFPEKEYSSIDLIDDLINYFYGLSLYQTISWISWIVVSYIICLTFIHLMKLDKASEDDENF